MQTGIVGLPFSGKTTIHNSITGSNIETGINNTQKSPNLGVAHVPDKRLEHLTKIYTPKKTIQAELMFSDIPVKRDGEIFYGENISHLQKMDALLVVVRAFTDESIPHIDGSVDLERDLEKITFDLIFSDISLIDRRIMNIQDSMKRVKANERAKSLKTIESLKNIQGEFEKGIPLRNKKLSEQEKLVLSDTFLLSKLPLMIVVNIDEKDIKHSSEIQKLTQKVIKDKASESAVICGLIEEELSKLSFKEQSELRKELNFDISGLDKTIHLTYSSLGLVSFITVGEDEVRAWTISQATSAEKAASVIHSDISKGFIRAEVVSYNDFIKFDSMVQIKNKGLLRKEGKDYKIQDGDIVNYLFSV